MSKKSQIVRVSKLLLEKRRDLGWWDGTKLYSRKEVFQNQRASLGNNYCDDVSMRPSREDREGGERGFGTRDGG
jgi:hypothetical protein